MAASSPAAAQVIDDLLRSGTGLDVIEHRVGSHAEAPPASDQPLAVRRGDQLLAYEDGMPLNPEDILVCVRHVGDHIRGFGTA
jgi:hypothetical protein